MEILIQIYWRDTPHHINLIQILVDILIQILVGVNLIQILVGINLIHKSDPDFGRYQSDSDT